VTKQIKAASVRVQYSFTKSKIKRSLSYPLKRSLLDSALENSSIGVVALVFYFMRHGGNIVMRVDFMGEGHGVGLGGNASVTLYSVPSKEKHQIQALLVTEGLPRVCGWLQRVEQAGNAWRAKNHSIVLEFVAGALKISEE
jgi:hypothetical protein